MTRGMTAWKHIQRKDIVSREKLAVIPRGSEEPPTHADRVLIGSVGTGRMSCIDRCICRIAFGRLHVEHEIFQRKDEATSHCIALHEAIACADGEEQDEGECSL